MAGNRKGDNDERWLWPQFAEVIRIFQPQWVLCENVPGLLSAKSGRLMRGILFDLSQMGFDAEWGTFPAAAFGAPHLRERVFLVAYNFQQSLRNTAADNFESRQPIGKESGSDGTPRIDSHHNSPRPQERQSIGSHTPAELQAAFGADWRTTLATIRKSDHGISCGLVRDRANMLRCLGNAVVPQVAQWIGQRIMSVNAGGKECLPAEGDIPRV